MKTTERFLLGYVLPYAITAAAQPPVPAGTIDPSTIPRYVMPLVIPPVMKDSSAADDYEIAVRQFSQQILPGGIWNLISGRDDPFPATPVPIVKHVHGAHPIHLHLVRFQVIGREAIPGFDSVAPVVQPWEARFKDTVIAYPGEITTVRATFDIEGLYVWHCHIVEHEDNEMMRPFVVSAE